MRIAQQKILKLDPRLTKVGHIYLWARFLYALYKFIPKVKNKGLLAAIFRDWEELLSDASPIASSQFSDQRENIDAYSTKLVSLVRAVKNFEGFACISFCRDILHFQNLLDTLEKSVVKLFNIDGNHEALAVVWLMIKEIRRLVYKKLSIYGASTPTDEGYLLNFNRQVKTLFRSIVPTRSDTSVIEPQIFIRSSL